MAYRKYKIILTDLTRALISTSFFICLLFNSIAFSSPIQKQQSFDDQPIALLNWWSYVTSDVQKKLSDNKFVYSVIEYRSNEVALSKLLSSDADYDAVIVSNWVLKVLKKSNYLDNSFNKSLLQKRDYISFLKKIDDSCIPYLWSTTTFARLSSNHSTTPTTVAELLELKKKNFKIALIDDPIELMARIILDNKDLCLDKNNTKSNPLDLISQCGSTLNTLSKNLDVSDFRNSLETFLAPETAVYGWHGAVGALLPSHPNLTFVLPQSDIVLGADYVCIPKKKKYKKNLKKFVEILTSKENTQIQASQLQYFSPYKNHEFPQHPKIIQLKRDVLEKIKHSDPVFLMPPNSESHEKINHWWQKIRYGKKE